MVFPGEIQFLARLLALSEGLTSSANHAMMAQGCTHCMDSALHMCHFSWMLGAEQSLSLADPDPMYKIICCRFQHPALDVFAALCDADSHLRAAHLQRCWPGRTTCTAQVPPPAKPRSCNVASPSDYLLTILDLRVLSEAVCIGISP